jgi:two-component system chemotaxis response regulator CheY
VNNRLTLHSQTDDKTDGKVHDKTDEKPGGGALPPSPRRDGKSNAGSPSNAGRKMLRILIVEDEPVNRELLLLSLRGLGECKAVATGEDAVLAQQAALEQSQPFDVVFLDILLPGMNGLQALEQLRALEDRHQVPQDRRAPVIVTTGLDDDQTASRAFIQGQALSYMTKPFRTGQISEDLRKLRLIA